MSNCSSASVVLFCGMPAPPNACRASPECWHFLCRPLLSQVRDCWKGMNSHLAMIQTELQIPRGDVDLVKVLGERYKKSYHAV
jgi:hypothetical protein